jgi:hypothetical protein
MQRSKLWSSQNCRAVTMTKTVECGTVQTALTGSWRNIHGQKFDVISQIFNWLFTSFYSWFRKPPDRTRKRKDVVKHIERRHLRLQIPCEVCDVTFASRDQHRIHMRAKHFFNAAMGQKVWTGTSTGSTCKPSTFLTRQWVRKCEQGPVQFPRARQALL